MLSVFSALKRGTKIRTIVIDSTIFRLHYSVSVTFMLAFSVIVTTRQYVGNPIDCIHTKDIPEDVRETDKSKIQLKLSYQSDTVETEEKVGVRVLRDKTEGDVPEKLFVQLNRQDKGWASGKVELKGDAEIIAIL